MLSLEYSSGVGGGVGTHVQELSTGLSLAGDFVTALSGTVGSPNHFVDANRSVHLVATLLLLRDKCLARKMGTAA